MKDPSAPQIGIVLHVLMAFADAETVNPNLADFAEGDLPIKKTQLGFMDLFDQVPACFKIVCNPADGPEANVDTVWNLLTLSEWCQTTGFLPCPYHFVNLQVHICRMSQEVASPLKGYKNS